jgi:hypothetical protein
MTVLSHTAKLSSANQPKISLFGSFNFSNSYIIELKIDGLGVISGEGKMDLTSRPVKVRRHTPSIHG